MGYWEEVLDKFKKEFMIIVMITFISVFATFGFNNYLVKGIAFNVLSKEFFKQASFCFLIVLDVGAFAFLVLIALSKLLKR